MPTADLPPLTGNSTQSRIREVATFTLKYCSVHYTTDGRWNSPATDTAPDLRKTLWLCFGLLANDDDTAEAEAARALANHILACAGFQHHSRPRSPEEAASRFDIFITNHAVQMLVVHGEKLTVAVRRKLEDWARAALDDYPGDRQADYQFHGANDNMPAKATLGLILGGEYFGDDYAVAHGLWNLRQLRDLLTRRGLLSEYTSPTYSPLTLVNLTEIALHARHPEAAALARQCCERIWADILGHYHAPTGTMAGPYARAYELDSTAHFSTAACLLWLALGEGRTPFNPVEELQRDPVRLIHHHDDRTTQLGVLAWLTACPLVPPPHLLRWVETRGFPFRLRADAERIARDAAEVHTSLYAEEDFALGTSFGEPWSGMQSEAFFLQYRRRAPRSGPAFASCDITDLRTLYTRYLFNDQRPHSAGHGNLLKPHALVHTIHKDRIALVLARPLERLARQPVRALKFSAIIPTPFCPLEHIEIRKGDEGRCAHHVFIKDGPIYIALRGLHATRWGDDCANVLPTGICLEPTPGGDYMVVSFYNYAGSGDSGRLFTEEEIMRTQNGFVAVVGLASEETFERFKHRVSASVLVDYYAFDQRTITYELGRTRLSASYAMPTNRFRYATINDQPMPRPRWQADGLPEPALPFLDGTSAGAGRNPLTDIPHKHMRVVWDPEKPWQIASRPRA
ncbi:hypothetical protein OpiT1DRAFT_02771 [Opitutaceae bacterium TAV1]|nr:hypothetical protein OpiT1DRAFT_02771 [Opitutaceae bacterium TAV1]